jgi:hypothetical protein
MTESALWSRTRDTLAPFGALKRIENAVDLGTPDLAYALKAPAIKPFQGWIELKHAPSWPARGGPLIFPHLTVEQVQWHEAWRAAGGRVHALFQVERDCFVVGRKLRLLMIRGVDRNQLEDDAVLISWGRFFGAGELIRCLAKG